MSTPSVAQGFGERLQQTLQGLGNRIEQGAKRFERNIQREIAPPKNSPVTRMDPVPATTISGQCEVFNIAIQKIDSEACRLQQTCLVNDRCVLRYFWPSGAVTVVETRGGRPYQINGKPLNITQVSGLPCATNAATGNTFCFRTHTDLLTDQAEAADEDVSSPPEDAENVASLPMPKAGADVPVITRRTLPEIGREKDTADERASRTDHNTNKAIPAPQDVAPAPAPKDVAPAPDDRLAAKSMNQHITPKTPPIQAEAEESVSPIEPPAAKPLPDPRDTALAFLSRKRAEFEKLDPGLESLVATDDYTLPINSLRDLRIDKRDYFDFFANPLNQTRSTALQIARAAIDGHVADLTLDGFVAEQGTICGVQLTGSFSKSAEAIRGRDGAKQQLTNYCDQRLDVKAHALATLVAKAEIDRVIAVEPTLENWLAADWFDMNTADLHKLPVQYQDVAIQQFRQGTAEHRRQVEQNSAETLQALYREARPLEESDRKATAACGAIRKRSAAFQQFCNNLENEMGKRRSQKRCDLAVENFGGSDDLLETRFSFDPDGDKYAFRVETVTMRQLLCNAGVIWPGYEFRYQSAFFGNPSIIVSDAQKDTVLRVTIRKASSRDGRSFGKTLVDIASGENDQPVDYFYTPDRIESAKAQFAGYETAAQALGCVFLGRKCLN